MATDLRTTEVEALLDVLARIDDKDILFALLEDMFTIREIRESSQRLAVAGLLDKGCSYTQIEKATGASATTIARVSKCLGHGSGGYRAALSVLRKLEGAEGDKAAAGAEDAEERGDRTGQKADLRALLL